MLKFGEGKLGFDCKCLDFGDRMYGIFMELVCFLCILGNGFEFRCCVVFGEKDSFIIGLFFSLGCWGMWVDKCVGRFGIFFCGGIDGEFFIFLFFIWLLFFVIFLVDCVDLGVL